MEGAFAVGAAERAVELFTERIRAVARPRRQAHRHGRRTDALARGNQKTKIARLLVDVMVERTRREGDALEDWTLEESGEQSFDRIPIGHAAKDAVRLVADGSGSSAYQLDNPSSATCVTSA